MTIKAISTDDQNTATVVDDPEEIASLDHMLHGMLLILVKRLGGEVCIKREEWDLMLGDTLVSTIDKQEIILRITSKHVVN